MDTFLKAIDDRIKCVRLNFDVNSYDFYVKVKLTKCLYRLDFLFQKLKQPLSLFAFLLFFLSFYYFLSPYLSIILRRCHQNQKIFRSNEHLHPYPTPPQTIRYSHNDADVNRREYSLTPKLTSWDQYCKNYIYHNWTAILLWQDFDALCGMLSEFSSWHTCACY